MSQADYIVDNASGAVFRADLNAQLEAIATWNSGASAPSPTYPYMPWPDTTNSRLKQRNGANTSWIDQGPLDTANFGMLPATYLDTDAAMAADSDTKVPSQKAVRAYIAANASGGTLTITAGENLSDRDLCYFDEFNQRSGGAGKVYKVDADAVGPVRIGRRLCIALSAITSGATGSSQVLDGQVTDFTGLTAGGPVYASATAGGLTQTTPAVPSSGSQVASRLVGFATSSTAIWFSPDPLTTFIKYGAATTAGSSIVAEHFTDSGAADRIVRAYIAASSGLAAITPSGSAFGDMSAGGGLAAAFDGTTSQAHASCAKSTTTTSPHYIGKSFGTTTAVSRVVVTGSNDSGFVVGDGGAAQITIKVYGKTGAAPSSAADGTLLVTDTATTDSNGLARTIDFTEGSYDHVWAHLSENSGNIIAVAELQYFGPATARNEPVTIGSETVNGAATDRVTAKFVDASDANADTKTTFYNRTGGTRDLIVEVTL